MRKLVLILSILILCNCQKDTKNDIYIIEAYLYANQPVNHIRIMKRSFDGDYAVNIPVTNAEVIIEDKNRSYILHQSSSNSGWYEYSNNDLMITEGEIYKLFITIEGNNMYSQVLVPFSPTNTQIDKDTLYKYSITTDISQLNKTFLQLKWVAPTEYSCIVLESIEKVDNRESIYPPGTLKYQPYFLQKPIIDSSLTINSSNFEYYGKNMIKIYSVNNEYVNVFKNPENSVGLSYYPSNISNAIGLFTAFSCDSVAVYVEQNLPFRK